MKKILRIIPIIAVLLALLLPLPLLAIPVMAEGPEWTITGNKVFINDSNVYLSATPHTLGSSGWVEFEVLSKNYSGEVDVGFGFTGEEGSASNLQIWRNVRHVRQETVNILKSHTVHNVSEYNAGYVPDYSENATFYPIYGNAPYTGIAFIKSDEFPDGVIVYYDSYTGNLQALTVNYYDYTAQEVVEWYPDWGKINRPMNTAYVQIDEAGRWETTYLDAAITAGVSYKLRVWVEIPWSPNGGRTTGKYFFGIKPHDETLQQAVDTGHLYYLDPWWDAQWAYRNILSFNMTSVGENLTDWPLLVTISPSNHFDFSKFQADGDDIRFVDSDDTTVLDFYLEYWDSANETGLAWVRVPQIDAHTSYSDYIYIYYGNPGAANSENSSAVYTNDYRLVSTYNSSNATIMRDATAYSNNGTIIGAAWTELPSTLWVSRYDGADDVTTIPTAASLDITEAITVEVWGRPIALADNDVPVGKVTPGVAGYMIYAQPDGDTIFFGYGLTDTTVASGPGAVSAGNWSYIAGVYDLSALHIYVNAVPEDSDPATGNITVSANDLQIGEYAATANFANWDIGLVRVSAAARSDTKIMSTFQQVRHLFGLGSETFIYYGNEDPPPTLSTLAATSVTANSYTMNGNLSSLGGAPTADYWFEYGATASLGSTTTPTNTSSTGTYSEILTAPTSDTTIYYRFVAENVDGTTYGSVMTVGFPSAIGSQVLKTLLRVILAGVIIIGVMMSSKGGGRAMAVAGVLGIIAFIIVDTLISTL